MKSAIALLVLLSFVGVAAQTNPEFGIRDKTPRHIAFTNARIVVSPSQTVDNGTLLIENGLVKAVGASIDIPAHALTIDLNGKTIYPGFIDPVSDYGLSHIDDLNPKKAGRKPVYHGDRTGATAWTLMPRGASCWARVRVRWWTAALLVEYA